MAESFKLLKEEWIHPQGIQAETIRLAPIDLSPINNPVCMSWPFFYDYTVDATRLKEALEKLCVKYPILCGRVAPDEDVRFCLKIDPENDQAFGFPFFEMQADMTFAHAMLTYGRLTASDAKFPVGPDKMPFYMEAVPSKAIHSGEKAPVTARLTHFKDGCAVTLCVSHMLMDGQRLVELYRDLGRAYRGVEIPDRCHDRSHMWPDQLAKCFPFLGEDIAQLPRKATPDDEMPSYVQFPDDSMCLETLYFPKETLEDMKAKVKPFLEEGQFVSSNDVLVAFNWMLSTEIYEERTEPIVKGTDLELSKTMTPLTIEYLQNGAKLFPENYCGNGYGYQTPSLEGHDLEGKSLEETFAELSMIIRKNVTDFRTQPHIPVQTALAYYVFVTNNQVPIDTTLFRGGMTSMVKMPTKEIDFGDGPAKMAYIIGPAPFFGSGFGVSAPGPGKGDGIMLHIQITEKQRSRIKTSSVVRECAPGMKQFFSDFSEEDLYVLFDM